MDGYVEDCLFGLYVEGGGRGEGQEEYLHSLPEIFSDG